jgi:phage terminase large subunit-like protein
MGGDRSIAHAFGEEPDWFAELIADWPAERAAELRWLWGFWARPEQLAPAGEWSSWLILAGRGFGKTRAGAEWVRRLAETQPALRIALIGATLDEARAVMVEGESGLLAIAPPDRRPIWEPSQRRLRWPNGAQAFTYSAAEPDSLRGPVHHFAWADEIAKWPDGIAAWDMMLMGLRLGYWPRAMATTTPRPTALVRRLAASRSTVLTRGRMADNAGNLPIAFRRAMEEEYGGTRTGRQELDGVLFEDVAGALWTRAMIEACRGPFPAHGGSPPELVRVVIGVDPPAGSEGDACGIVAVGLGRDGDGVVLEHASVSGRSPEGWARAVSDCAARHEAELVVAEANNGGDMVRSVLDAAAVARLPVRLVHASRGKAARAEPVALLYERGRIRHLRAFPELEDQLCGLKAGGGYESPGRSPDRADALVWALTMLMLRQPAEPRVRAL